MQEAVEILIAEDEEDQQILIKEAFSASHLNHGLHFVKDGVEVLEFLRCEGAYAHRATKKLPGLIMLDLNMPRKDGRAALVEIKQDPIFRLIPVIVMTTSYAKSDIYTSYAMGANSYITKPVDFQHFLEAMSGVNRYWVQIVTLPDLQFEEEMQE